METDDLQACGQRGAVCVCTHSCVCACMHTWVCVCIWGGAILLVAELPRGYGGKKPHKEIKTKLQFLHIRADTEIWVQ